MKLRGKGSFPCQWQKEGTSECPSAFEVFVKCCNFSAALVELIALYYTPEIFPKTFKNTTRSISFPVIYNNILSLDLKSLKSIHWMQKKEITSDHPHGSFRSWETFQITFPRILMRKWSQEKVKQQQASNSLQHIDAKRIIQLYRIIICYYKINGEAEISITFFHCKLNCPLF